MNVASEMSVSLPDVNIQCFLWLISGVIGGGLDGHTGGGSEYVCLPGSPEYGKFQAGANAYNYIYGAEFMAYSGLFNTANMYSFTHQNAACVACLSIRNSKVKLGHASDHFDNIFNLDKTEFRRNLTPAIVDD